MEIDSLIPENIMDQLPDGEEGLREVVIAARRSLDRVLSTPELQGSLSRVEWRRQLVFELYGAAAGLNEPFGQNIDDVIRSETSLDRFDAFLTQLLSTIRFKHRVSSRIDSVALSPISKENIRADLEVLRQRVNDSNLSSEIKSALHDRINTVEAELDRSRSRLSVVWLLAGALAILPQSIGALADIDDAVDNIHSGVNAIASTFHEEKFIEQREDDRRAGRPLQIATQPLRQLTDQSANAKAGSNEPQITDDKATH